jgi:integrase
MSVYKRPGGFTYSYDFIVGGNRFSGDTGKTREREARQEQDRLKRLEKTRFESSRGKTGVNLTFGAAAARYMEEVGEHHVNALTTLSNLEWLQLHIGKNTLLSAIDENKVAFLVARRRQDFRQVGRLENRTKKISAATVNRTCTEPLRKVLRRASLKWGAGIQDIDWSSHMLKEPKERVREASPGEEAAFMDELGRGYDIAVEFATLTGCRRMEVVGLVWQRVDFF